MTQTCRFCEIVSGRLPASLVLEDDECMAFLDNRPLFPGHCLLVPKAHCETLPDLPDELLLPLFADVRLLARAVEEGMGAEGTFIAVNNRISQSVPHLHVHIVPRRRKDGLKGFFWPRNPYRDPEEIKEVTGKLKAAVQRLRPPGGTGQT